MKKVLVFALFVVALLGLASCGSDKYKEEAGKYSLYSVGRNDLGITLSSYEYFTMDLTAGGKMTVESKTKGATTTYSAKATFKIEDGKIYIYTKNGVATITETYTYTEDGEIHMESIDLPGQGSYELLLKFKRSESK